MEKQEVLGAGKNALKATFRLPVVLLVGLFGVGYFLEGVQKLSFLSGIIGIALILFAYFWWKLPLGYQTM
jgi:hypothetical protein